MPKSGLLCLSLFFAIINPLIAATLVPQPPVELTGTHGKFDFIKIDAANHRLLACHTGNNSLDVIDLATSKLLKNIPTGAAQGVAIDDKGGRYFVSVSKPPQLVIVDAAKLEATGTVTLTGPADLCAYSAKLNRVFVDNDEKPETWVINPDTKEIIHSWTWGGGGMEDLAFNADGTIFIQNVKDTSKLMVVDYAKFPLLAGDGPMNGNDPTTPISTLPAEKPHGLAMAGNDKVLIAGGTGKLVLIDYKGGKAIASTDISPRVDEVAFDSGNGKVYCASGTGVISVVSVGKDTLGTVENIPSAQGAHSIAVDPNTHTVWIVFTKNDKAYVQSFLAGKILKEVFNSGAEIP